MNKKQKRNSFNVSNHILIQKEYTMEKINEKTWPEYYSRAKVVELSNGETMIRRFGKYMPNLIFLLSEENISVAWHRNDMEPLKLNIEFDGDLEWMPGDFWVSKKGSNCFRPKQNGKDLLIKIDWGGPFIASRGTEYDSVKSKALYARRAPSNGGGEGYNFYVFPKDYVEIVNINEI